MNKKILLTLVIIVVVLIGLIGWIWFKNSGYWYFDYYVLHEGPPPGYCDPGPCLSSTIQKVSITPTSSSNYLAIKEWGVEFEKPTGMDDLQYTIFGNTTNTIAFTTQSLVSLDMSTGGKDCTADQGPIGTLTRVGNFDTYTQSQHYIPTNLEIGNYYYFFTTTQATCSANQQVQALETQQMSVLKSKIFQTLTDGTYPTTTNSASTGEQNSTLTADPASGKPPLVVTFGAHGFVGQYLINFGDGESGQVSIVPLQCPSGTGACGGPAGVTSHTYQSAGTYTATLLDASDYTLGTATITVTTTSISPTFPNANIFPQPIVATSMENPGKYTYAFSPIPTSTGSTAMQLVFRSPQGTNFIVPDNIALQLGFGYNNVDERIDVEGIMQNPADSNVVFVSSMSFNPNENYNATSTNTIYAYSLETKQLTQIYKEQPNQYRDLNFEGLQGSRLVIWFGAPGYDKPCANWTASPVYLELSDTGAGLQTFKPTPNEIAASNAEVQQCVSKIGGD